MVEREALEYTQVDTSRLSDPGIAFDKELIELVWDAAAALDRDGYSLLDLHLRHDLSVDELACELEVPREQLAWQLSRLCNALENSVASTLLATRARHNCEDLDAALSSNRHERRPIGAAPCARVRDLSRDEAAFSVGDRDPRQPRSAATSGGPARAGRQGVPGARQAPRAKATLTAPGRLAQLGERLPYTQEVAGFETCTAHFTSALTATCFGPGNGARELLPNEEAQ